jgi:hypothetical protein
MIPSGSAVVAAAVVAVAAVAAVAAAVVAVVAVPASEWHSAPTPQGAEQRQTKSTTR